MLFTVPPDEDFPAPDRFGILSTVTALVFQSVMDRGAAEVWGGGSLDRGEGVRAG